jgi:hypothetical protein
MMKLIIISFFTAVMYSCSGQPQKDSSDVTKMQVQMPDTLKTPLPELSCLFSLDHINGKYYLLKDEEKIEVTPDVVSREFFGLSAEDSNYCLTVYMDDLRKWDKDSLTNKALFKELTKIGMSRFYLTRKDYKPDAKN